MNGVVGGGRVFFLVSQGFWSPPPLPSERSPSIEKGKNSLHLVKADLRIVHIKQVSVPRGPGEPRRIASSSPPQQRLLAPRGERGVDVLPGERRPLARPRRLERVLDDLPEAHVRVRGERGRGVGRERGRAEGVGDGRHGGGTHESSAHVV